MTVRTKHPDYLKMAPLWQKCRDATAGQHALAGERRKLYIKPLCEQSTEEYDNYVDRTVYFNATERTIEGLLGLLFRKAEETKELPGAIKKFEDDIDMAGEPLHVFSQECAREIFEVGRVGVMTDHPEYVPRPDGRMPTQLELENDAGHRPMMSRYTAESIWNWKFSRVNNAQCLVKVVLNETQVVPGGNEFEEKTEPVWRVLDLVPVAGKLVYRVRMFRVNQTTGRDELLWERIPTIGKKALEKIPFQIISINGLGHKTKKPPLLDLVNVNLGHYKVSADYEHGCHFTGLPTPYVAGFQPTNPNEKLFIGSTQAWTFINPDTKAGFLEFTGAGMGCLEKNLDRKEIWMAKLGARLISGDVGSNESENTVMLRQSGEMSVLAAACMTLSLGLTHALDDMALWAQATGKVKYQLNRDFFPIPMTPQMLAELVKGWQAGVMSFQELFGNLKRGELFSADADAETEQARIEAEGPKLQAPTASSGKPGQPGAPAPAPAPANTTKTVEK